VTVVVLSVCLSAATGGALADCAPFQDPFELLDLHVEIDPADWETVRQDATFEVEKPATFRCGDEGPFPIHVRRKISYALPSDANPIKVSLKIDFDDLVPEGEWHGHRKLSLENGISDPVYPSALLREGVAWILMARAGVIAGGSFWARVHVNGRLLGVYTCLEQIDKSFLRRHIGEDEGFLYKLDWRSGEVRHRLTREGEPDPYDAALCYLPFDTVCPPPEEGIASLREHLDIHQLFTMATVNIFLANIDGFLESDNNYFWYNSERPRLYFPWDLDLALLPWHLETPPHTSKVELAVYDFAPELREYFDRTLSRLLDDVLSPDALDALMDQVSASVGPAMEADDLSGLEGGFAAEAARLRSWLGERSRFLAASLPAFEPEPLVVNEVLASNLETSRDEGGEAADWIEVFNRSDAEVLLDAHYLSDDPARPKRWRVPEVLLPAGGRVLVWCDHDVDQGPFHSGFQLEKGGEAVGLYVERNGIIRAVDFVRFGPQETDVSLGRFPDGAPTFRRMPCPTPEGPNRLDCPGGASVFVRGDVTGDASVDMTDAVGIAHGRFRGGPIDCLAAADASDDGRLGITDAIIILRHLFSGGPPPPFPYPACGNDPTPDRLDCRMEPACAEGLRSG
jgi:hypothetical protein